MNTPLTCAQFIDRYYKPDRLTALPGRRERIITDRLSDLLTFGHAAISRHDSVTGRVVLLMANGTATRTGDAEWHPWNAGVEGGAS